MEPNLKNKVVLVHGIMMIFVWLFAVPFAVGANIYARKKQEAWGVKVHMYVMACAAILPYTVSAALAFTASGKLNPKPHSIIGTLMSIGVWIQFFLGVGNHMLFRYRLRNNCLPSKRPWNNHVHIWFGKLLMIMALVNITLGMKIKRAGITVFVVYVIWVSFLVGCFIYLTWMKEETRGQPSQIALVKDDSSIADEIKEKNNIDNSTGLETK